MTSYIRFHPGILHVVQSKKRVALIDIDGVVVDNSHRLHYIACVVDGRIRMRQVPDWDAFHRAQSNDSPGDYVGTVVSLYEMGIELLFVTGRILNDGLTGSPEETLKQLRRFVMPNIEERQIVMRPNIAATAAEFKSAVARILQELGVPVALAIDDSHENCLEFARLGVPTLRAYNHLDESQHHY